MTISDKINNYLKDSMISGKVCRFNKYNISIYVSRIVSKEISESEKQEYYEIIQKAANIWNKYGLFNFSLQAYPQNADIVINWVKTGRVFEGMCKYRSIISSEIRAVTIDIGLPNKYSPKTINKSTILHSALHELGHAVGLGHGVEENDVMFVPHKKTLVIPSENDIFVLKKLYSAAPGTNLHTLAGNTSLC